MSNGKRQFKSGAKVQFHDDKFTLTGTVGKVTTELGLHIYTVELPDGTKRRVPSYKLF